MFDLGEDHKLTLNTVRKLSQEKIKPIASEIDETDEFPWGLVNLFTENGLLSPLIPQDFGGAGLEAITFRA